MAIINMVLLSRQKVNNKSVTTYQNQFILPVYYTWQINEYQLSLSTSWARLWMIDWLVVICNQYVSSVMVPKYPGMCLIGVDIERLSKLNQSLV